MNALPPLITQHLDEVRALCEKYHVKRLTLFGSAVKGTFDEETSDLDFVVEFEWHPDPIERGRRWTYLWEELKDVFGGTSIWSSPPRSETRTSLRPSSAITSTSMQPDVPARLQHILDAGEMILQITAGKTFDDYETRSCCVSPWSVCSGSSEKPFAKQRDSIHACRLV